MGKTLKLVICGKKAIGKTTILEQLIYNNQNFPVLGGSKQPPQQQQQLATGSQVQSQQQQQSTGDKYFSTIEDIYVACWERDKGVKEKLRIYDTKGLENAKDVDTLSQIRTFFQQVDGAVLVFSSADPDSIQCVEKLKVEIEKSKDKKETCHFILIDYQQFNTADSSAPPATTPNKDQIRQELQTKLRCNVYELNGLDKRDLLCKPFIDLATNITQVSTKSSMNIVQSIKKPKVFSSNK
jgi:NF-kappa-B inhibitor-interacting Ras-like protein